MKRARPVHALGATPRKDHLFVDGRSLCDSWMYFGGRGVDPSGVEQDGELCKRCERKAKRCANE